ncbi:MAG: dTDP-4-dehydrorhamnose reductase [Deltaproteobacteria bacterium]|jgi:dTDP-4-dehydrorhamnose reductase|nr:dTDP-4-dehydrorhamnose reductase [Deltaproteobacteria bacterium]MBW2656163.1 dTDP-4-dehydrorhamnose reductase [Deltaproteobacteria bacterium]
MKILITGAGGQLGRELINQGQLKGFSVQAPSEDDMDITDLEKIDRCMAFHQPEVVINAAAYTQVDKAESEAALAFAVNTTGSANLARMCAKNKIPLVHISTDYVFDGQKGRSYLETDAISPVGVYGRSKAEGEIEIRSHLKEHIILRTSWLYGIHGHNFAKTMLKLATTKPKIRVVADQYGSPTNAADLAQTILIISDRMQFNNDVDWGTYHYCGQGVISWYNFAEKIVGLARLYADVKTTRIEPITTADYPTRALRPIYSALDCSRIQKHFGINPKPWQKSLEITIKELLVRR